MIADGACIPSAWIVSKANEYARNHGLASFVAYQGEWSLLRRDLEREIIPMCRSEGMALMPYGVLGQGKFKTKQEIKERQATGLDLRKFWGDAKQSDQELAVSEALESMASELGATSLGQVAVAYHLQKYPYVFPILGCRTVEQMRTNVGVSLSLTTAAQPSSQICHFFRSPSPSACHPMPFERWKKSFLSRWDSLTTNMGELCRRAACLPEYPRS